MNQALHFAPSTIYEASVLGNQVNSDLERKSKRRNVVLTLSNNVSFFLKAYRDEEEFFAESVTVTNKDGHMKPVSKSVLYPLRSSSKNPLLSQGFSLKTIYTKSGKIDEIILRKAVNSDEMARNAVTTFRKYFPSLVSASQVAVSDRKIFKISHFEDVHCSREVSKATVYQMLSNKCSGMKLPTISAVQLVCSTSLGLCEIGIQAALNPL